MAKPKSRVASAAIAGMLGVQPAPARSPGSASPEGPPASSHDGPHTTQAPEGAHPVRDRVESGVARADNALILDPRRIARRGRYVRPFTDDLRFRNLLTAIAEAGNTIHVPVLVRVEGAPGSVEYVLVDGTHRVEAALRLGIAIPAVNLGRITAEQAFAIQAMANEVRASMHVVDQAAYVLTLLGQGLSRETVQRTTGFSAGRVSELSRIGTLLGTLSDEERGRARRAPGVTHRALRALVATSPDAFRRELRRMVESAPAEQDLEAFSDEIGSFTDRTVKQASGVGRQGSLVADRYQGDPSGTARPRRGRAPSTAGGVSFAMGRNTRGTSVTFRMAWRARGVRTDPELFLERVRDALQAIAAEATAHYELATARRRGPARHGADAQRKPRAWRDAIAREEAELRTRVADRPDAAAGAPSGDVRAADGIADADNPMPVPPSRRRPGEPYAGISPRLLTGLSLPMLAERLKRQSRAQMSEADRGAEEAHPRAEDAQGRHTLAEQMRPPEDEEGDARS